MSSAPPFLTEFWEALGGAPDALEAVTVVGRGDLASVYRVTDLAVAAVAAAGLAAAELVTSIGAAPDDAAQVTVDRGIASAWYGTALTPVGWAPPPAWDPLAGDYRARDGWIRLHTNAPHHRSAALAVLGAQAEKVAVTRAVAAWGSVELETAIVAAGGCAAAISTLEQWDAHPQGRAVGGEPLVEWADGAEGTNGSRWDPLPGRPLNGLRVLDLTRVIAGPVATRFLAGLGADVLRIDPAEWNENALVPDMTLGKRAARLDARTDDGRERMRELIAGCDVLVHGYRSGALTGLGLPMAERGRLRSGLVEASLNAYGFTGPWSHRRGFDSLVQMSSGIASRGMGWAGTDAPTPLPVQALDHTAGYLVASAVLRGITLRVTTGRGAAARTSLARIARALVDGGESRPADSRLERAEPDVPLDTPWGPAVLLPPPVEVTGVAFGFDRGPRALGSDDPSWV